MKDEELLGLLEETIRKLSIRLDYDDLKKGEINTHGGAFILRGEKHILVHKQLSIREKAEVLLEILSNMDTEGIHLPAALRERMERVKPNIPV